MPDRPGSSRVRRVLAALPLIGICAFLLFPLVIVVISSFNARNSFRFPPEQLSLRWYGEVFGSTAWVDSLLVSGRLVLLVAPLVVLLGTLGGYALGTGRFPGHRMLSLLFLSPITVPSVMLGLALLHQLQGAGLVGSTTGLVLAHMVVAFPFCVRVVAVSAAAIDPQLARAAQSLGSSPLRTFCTVTVPLLRPGILAGAFLTAVISLGEVAVSVFVSGSRTVTVPVRVYSAVQVQMEPTVAAISTLLLLASVAVIAILERVLSISRFL